MKKLIVIAILLGALIINVFATDAKINGICTDLLQQRAIAWAMVIDETKAVEDFNDIIVDFEMGIQLSDDILFFGQMKAEATDMETVTILSFKATKVEYSGETITAWGEQIAIINTMQGTEEIIKINQKMTIKKIKRQWYIKSIEVLTSE